MKKLLLALALVAVMFTGCHKDPDNGGGNGGDNGGGNAATYTVTFDANGGRGEMPSMIFTQGVSQTLLDNTFTWIGNEFLGWNTSSDGTGTAYTNMQEITVSLDMTLYAQWKRSLFSVSFSRKVYFSQGNLQYKASTNTWRFAEHQWDYVGTQNPSSGSAGGTVSGSDNANISPTYDGWIDLFGWGTGDNPTNTSTYYSDYSTFIDWGVNPISKGGNQASLWRTLTKDEYGYLLYTRTTTSGIRYAKAEVNGVAGVIILPDDWSSSYYTLSSTNTASAAFTANTITSANWTSKFEAHGAVFMPSTGYRNGTSVKVVSTGGGYWSSTPEDLLCAYFLDFYGSDLYIHSVWREIGLSVRLVAEE